MIKLGIGIITYNRIETLNTCLEAVHRCTGEPYHLVIADDGSVDGTAAHVRGREYVTVTGNRRGCAWNKNRALYYLLAYTNADPILLLEDDTFPDQEGWEQDWIAAARRWQHVNACYGLKPDSLPPGQGTPEDPYQCAAFGGQCTITTRDALNCVGFLDTRFRGYGWEHVEWTHRFRMRYEREWGLARFTLPCLATGVVLTWPGTSKNVHEEEENRRVYSRTRWDPVYRAAWQTDEEQRDLLAETTEAARQPINSRRAMYGRGRERSM